MEDFLRMYQRLKFGLVVGLYMQGFQAVISYACIDCFCVEL